MTIINAKITSTMLGIEDHGAMSFFVHLQWPGGVVGFGGYDLDLGSHGSCERTGNGNGYQAIRKILETVGVDTWEKLPGKYVRIDEIHAGHSLTRIGNLMEDRWFDIKEWMSKP